MTVMDQSNDLLLQTRRHFFGQCGVSLGSMALLSLQQSRAAASKVPFVNPLAAKVPQFAPKAKRVIYLFMAGGPSQLDLFDYKPKLIELNGQEIPKSYLEGKRFAFMNSSHGVK